MTDSYLKLRCLSVAEFETARFALRAEARASEKKKSTRASRALAPYELRVCARDRERVCECVIEGGRE